MSELDDEMGRRKDEEESDLPDPKAPISTRLKGSILTKLDAIAMLRRDRAREQGRSDDVVRATDRHFVLNSVLPDALDAELKRLEVEPDDDDRIVELAIKLAKEIDAEKKKKKGAPSEIDSRRFVADGTTRKQASGH